MLFKNRGTDENAYEKSLKLTLNGATLETVKEIKYLGYTLNDLLTSRIHLKSRKSLVYATIKNLNKTDGLSDHKQANVKLQLFNSFIRPKMLYGLENMYLNSKQQEALRTIDANIIKTILNLPNRIETTRFLNALGIIDIKDQININKMNFFSRICANELTRKLVEEVLKLGYIKDDSLLSEIVKLTGHSGLSNMLVVCQYKPHMIRNEYSVKFKQQKKLRDKIDNLPHSFKDVLKELAVFDIPEYLDKWY